VTEALPIRRRGRSFMMSRRRIAWMAALLASAVILIGSGFIYAHYSVRHLALKLGDVSDGKASLAVVSFVDIHLMHYDRMHIGSSTYPKLVMAYLVTYTYVDAPRPRRTYYYFYLIPPGDMLGCRPEHSEEDY
jgi:hypothetical protein